MSKKQAKKQLKNIQRCLKHLSSLVGYDCTLSREPTSVILLGNAGHANGIGKSDVEHILLPFKCVEDYDLYFPSQKQFSILFADQLQEKLVAKIVSQKIKDNVIHCAYLEQNISPDSIPSSLPPGLILVNNVISPDFEKELMKLFLEHAKETEFSQDDLKNRVTLHYGFKFDYKTNLVNLSAPLEHPIPDCVLKVIESIKEQVSISPNQLTVNIYQPGQGIPKHVDTHSVFTSEILSVSLGSDVIMDFKNPSSGHVLPVLLQARSLTVMSGEARYLWHHGIAPRKRDAIQDVVERGLRISLTLRECTSEPCQCSYPTQCDSQNYGKPKYSITDETDAATLEVKYVSEVYEDIADHFSNTRHSLWPGVINFLKSVKSKSLVVDVGCGNGKYLGSVPDLHFIGNDNSFNLCKICKDRGHEIFSCNALDIPLRNETCDAVICIAMLHHLTTPARRLTVLQNIADLLLQDGLAYITVWAQEQSLDIDSLEPCKPCPTDSTEEGVGRRHFDAQDVFVDWQHRRGGPSASKLYYRYYHVFRKGELEELIGWVEGVKLVEVSYEKANWCAVFRKL